MKEKRKKIKSLKKKIIAVAVMKFFCNDENLFKEIRKFS